MSVARDAGARFWCTNPAALADVLVSNLEDGGRLLSLANQIASTVREKDMKFAGIMGNLLEIAGGKANDWEMAERIKSIKKSFFEKYDAKTGDEVCRKSEEEIRRIIESA